MTPPSSFCLHEVDGGVIFTLVSLNEASPMAMVDTAAAPVSPAAAPAKSAYQPTTKMRWGHAFKALRKLLNDKDDTLQVFEIMRALNGASTAKGYQRLLTT